MGSRLFAVYRKQLFAHRPQWAQISSHVRVRDLQVFCRVSPQSDRVHFQHFHFFIILLPTLVAEERFQIFLGVDGPSVAKLAFRHVVLQYAGNPGDYQGKAGPRDAPPRLMA